jgi:RNA polymerase-binding transcription factor DksA
MIDTTTFRTKLEAERVRIINDLNPIALYDETTEEWVAIPDTEELQESDENNEADGREEWNERRATVAALEITFRNINRALDKIAAGTYGICEIGGEAIEADRLEFLPTARTCTTHMGDERTLSL